MSTRDNLLRLTTIYSHHTGMRSETIGQRALSASTTIARLESGKSVTIDTYDRLVAWLSDNWPAGVRWPKEVQRPVRSPKV